MHKASMSAAAAAKAVVELDADDQAMYERFVAANATTRYEWPDQKERSGKSGKADVKRRRKNRDARNRTSIDELEAVAAAESQKKWRVGDDSLRGEEEGGEDDGEDSEGEAEDENSDEQASEEEELGGVSNDADVKPTRHRITKNALAVRQVLQQLHARSGKLVFSLADALDALEQMPQWATRKGSRRCPGPGGDETDL
eukprot:6558442-Prymnesium_polylepis.2